MRLTSSREVSTSKCVFYMLRPHASFSQPGHSVEIRLIMWSERQVLPCLNPRPASTGYESIEEANPLLHPSISATGGQAATGGSICCVLSATWWGCGWQVGLRKGGGGGNAEVKDQMLRVMLRSSHCWERLPLQSLRVGTILSSSDGMSKHWLLFTWSSVSCWEESIHRWLLLWLDNFLPTVIFMNC